MIHIPLCPESPRAPRSRAPMLPSEACSGTAITAVYKIKNNSTKSLLPGESTRPHRTSGKIYVSQPPARYHVRLASEGTALAMPGRPPGTSSRAFHAGGRRHPGAHLRQQPQRPHCGQHRHKAGTSVDTGSLSNNENLFYRWLEQKKENGGHLLVTRRNLFSAHQTLLQNSHAH